ncbi:MAG: FAD-binding oxidoreductase [candidate division WOR-3 bacterium]
MSKTADTVVIGAGIIGAATGYYLAKRGHKVIVLEKDFPCAGSTGRCIGGIRAQFTHDLSIRVMLESIKVFSTLKDELGQDIEWFQGGYLFLAFDEQREQAFRNAIAIQRQYGLRVDYIGPKECKTIVADLNTDGLLGGAWCATDGQANPFKVTYGYLSGIRRFGGEVRCGSEVTAIRVHKERVVSVLTADGTELSTRNVVNAAGPWAGPVGSLAGVNVPVKPDRHESLVTEAAEHLFNPMLVDYRPDGCYFLQHIGTGHFLGCYTPARLVPGHGTESTDEFLTEMPRRMVRLVPRLAGLKVLRQWAGSYEMSPDGNPLCGITPVQGFYVAAGMSGHGFMFGPAIGKLMAELIDCGQTSLPLDQFSLTRDFGQAEAMK